MDEVFTTLYQEAKSFAAKVNEEEMMPHIAGGQQYRSTVPSTSPEEYWRRSIYFPFIDHLVQEIGSRLAFQSANPEFYSNIHNIFTYSSHVLVKCLITKV